MKAIIKIKQFIKYLYNIKYFHFFFTGVSGVVINLFFAWLFVEFVFAQLNYSFFNLIVKNTTLGIIIGNTINISYNFILHIKLTFKTKTKNYRRFGFFILHSLFMTYIICTPSTIILRNFFEKIFPIFLKESSYLIASGIVILFFSCFNFVFFKLVLFKEKKKEK